MIRCSRGSYRPCPVADAIAWALDLVKLLCLLAGLVVPAARICSALVAQAEARDEPSPASWSTPAR